MFHKDTEITAFQLQFLLRTYILSFKETARQKQFKSGMCKEIRI